MHIYVCIGVSCFIILYQISAKGTTSKSYRKKFLSMVDAIENLAALGITGSEL